jgi:polyferredoxin
MIFKGSKYLNPASSLMNCQKYKLPVAIFVFISVLLVVVQLKLENPLILAERLKKNAGWIEIFIVAFYGSAVGYHMQDASKAPRWRRITWAVFSVFFFSQLFIGLAGHEKFLMTGKLHLPVPLMILAGPLYRGEVSVMTVLFLSTVLLTGPAWCSHLCYFGALDNAAAAGYSTGKPLNNKTEFKFSILFLVILVTLFLRWMNLPVIVSTVIAALFGIAGIMVMLLVSVRKKKMVHCVIYCPVGTVVNFLKNVNPFRIYIDNSCTSCMKCIRLCKYDALDISEIRKGKPGMTCTLCGDCLSSCSHNSIKYKFPGLGQERSRMLWLLLTITLHSVFLALARL